MGGRAIGRALALSAVALMALAACAGIDSRSGADSPPAQPPVTATRFKVTPPGGFPFDAYLSAWGEGYVIYAPGRPPIYLVSDKKGGYIIQRPGESVSFVVPRKDGRGWDILSASGPATFLLKQGAGWILQPPGDLPTLITPQ
jgi:hypothetical protein